MTPVGVFKHQILRARTTVFEKNWPVAEERVPKCRKVNTLLQEEGHNQTDNMLWNKPDSVIERTKISRLTK